jgi:phosphoribosyl 1,2-cyclic phosphodiesterase
MQINVLATGSKGNLYSLNDGYTNILIECGLPFAKTQKLLNYNLYKYSACLISHEHKDHCESVYDVVKRMSVIMSNGTANVLNLNGNNNLITISKDKDVTIGSLNITPIPLILNAEEPIGFYIESLATNEITVFITDSRHSEYVFGNIDYLMIECNYSEAKIQENLESGKIQPFLYNRIKSDHLSLEALIEFLKHNQVNKKLILIHGSKANLDVEYALNEIRKVTTASINAKAERLQQ